MGEKVRVQRGGEAGSGGRAAGSPARTPRGAADSSHKRSDSSEPEPRPRSSGDTEPSGGSNKQETEKRAAGAARRLLTAGTAVRYLRVVRFMAACPPRIGSAARHL